jgi:thymidylate synthase (FAD)
MGKFKKGHIGYWLGKNRSHSIETKQKIRKALLGHKVSEETKKRAANTRNKNGSYVAWNKGIPWPKEMRKRISLANKAKGIEPKIKFIGRGKESPSWKGGITPENHKIRCSIEFRLWRESVFARDNWVCQECKIRGGVLHPHHIKPFAKYPELRFAIDNGITLCKKCHSDLHKGKNK